MKLLWITNIPSPYRTDFFNELGKMCSLTVLFEKKASKERDESWKSYRFTHFNGFFLKGLPIDVDKSFCPGVKKHLRAGVYDHIIVSDFVTPTGILAILYMRLKKIPYMIEGDGGFAKNGKGFKELIKKRIIKGAKAYFATSDSHENYFLTYGAKKERIQRYPFTSLWEKDIRPTVPTEEEKVRIREKLGIPESKIVLSVGRFIPSKGFDTLIKACRTLHSDTGIYIIGGNVTDEYLHLIKTLGIKQIHFLSFMSKQQITEYYQMADVFVLPTRRDAWGLVINEAMANGVPVITTDQCVAGLELIHNNENGFIVPVDDDITLGKKLNILLNNENLRLQMANKCLQRIKPYTMENMAAEHIRILNELSSPTTVLFLGSLSSMKRVNTLSGGSVSGNKMQTQILKFLNCYPDIKINILSVLSVAPFPKDKMLFVKKHTEPLFSDDSILAAQFIPFLNLPLIKQLWQAFALMHHAKKILRNNPNVIVFSFNLYPQTGLPLLWLQKKYQCKTLALLADLPIDDNYKRKGISAHLYNWFYTLTKRAINKCHHLIVLNRHAIERYNPSANYIVMDGGIDLSEYRFTEKQKTSSLRNIVYSGGLTEYNGIMNLIQAMQYVEPRDIELHIYGGGPLESYVRIQSDSLPNIKYFGRISAAEIPKIQQNAWLLINPRPVDDPIAQVTFPSKIFEYMLSGTPVLSTRLNGFSDNYKDKLVFADSNTPRVIAEKINEIADMDYNQLLLMAQNAKRFIMQDKSWDKQVNHIYQFIKDIDHE